MGLAPKPLRVLQLIERLELGGAERHVLDLTREIRNAGHACDVIARSGSLTAGVSYFEVTGKRRFADWFVALREVLARSGYDVLHVHSVPPLLAALMLAPWHRTPIIFTVHGWTAKKLRIARALMQLPVGPDRVVAVSAALGERLGAEAGSVVVVSNGVPDRVGKVRRVSAGPTIVSVGRLAYPKNQQQLIRAFALVKNALPDSRLEIIGDGPDRAALESLAREISVADAVTFRGVADPLPALLSARVFAATSESEGLSLAQLEALMVGLPLVVTDSSGSRQVVTPGKNGSIVAINDIDDTAEALLYWLTNEDDAARTHSRLLYESEFTIGAMVEQIIGLYDEVTCK